MLQRRARGLRYGLRRQRRPRCGDQPGRPSGRAAMQRRADGVSIVTAPGKQPRDQRVGVPHVPGSYPSRPQVTVGKADTSSNTCCDRSVSALTRCGLATAFVTSGITPSRQRRIS